MCSTSNCPILFMCIDSIKINHKLCIEGTIIVLRKLCFLRIWLKNGLRSVVDMISRLILFRVSDSGEAN